MNKVTIAILAAAILGLFVSLSFALSVANDDVLTEKISEVLKEYSLIEPGTTRGDLQKCFTTEGGISTATQRTYISRHCPYIKVDVTFMATADESPDDIIEKLSKPYLEYSIVD